MADYEKFMEVADRLGLKGEERNEFIKREIEQVREEKNRERDERALEREREKEEKALQREKEEKALEREREKEERMERERQRAFEREKEEKQRERETQIEVMRIQLEIERVKMNNSKSEDKNGDEHTSKKFYDKLKLREFKPKEDKIENYVEQFEMVCSSNQINKADWATLLLSRLTGPSMAVLAILSEEERKDYQTVKNKIMMFYGTTEENYRQKFRNIRLEKEKDPSNIILDVRNNMLRWLQLAEVNMEDPKQLLEMFVIDAVLCNASKSLFSFLKERKIRTEKNLLTAIATFSDSHPELELDKRSDTGHFLAAVETRDRQDRYRRNNNNRYHSMPAKCVDMRHIRCWTCNRTGHRARQCRMQGQNYGQNYGQ